MADFIHLHAAVEGESAEGDVMATVREFRDDESGEEAAPQSIPSLTDTQPMTASNEDFMLNGLKSHLVQNLTKKPKVPSGPLPPLAPLPSPLLCPRRTFLASLILASKFTQDRCYANKAWAKLSGLPPREIGRCERALGDALEWRLWVGKSPATAGVTSASSNRAVVRSKSDGELLANRSRGECKTFVEFGSSPPAYSSSAGLKRASTLPSTGFSQDPLLSTNTDVAWEPLSWTPPAAGGIASTSGSPATPSLTYSPSSTESSSGDRTIQMSSFIDVTPSPGQFVPLGTKVLHHHLSSEPHAAPYTYTAQHHAMLDVDPTSGLSFPLIGVPRC